MFPDHVSRKHKNMITVKAQKNLQAAKTYFDEHLERDDYYKEGGQELGKWRGKLALELGLNGEVSKEAFHRLAMGVHPQTGNKLTQRLRKDRVAYFDFVCSAPKSVSIVGLVAGDTRVVEAHQRAAESAFKFLERSAAVRDRQGAKVLSMERHYTGTIVAAVFDHEASRSLDCQLHRHMCVFNVTRDGSKLKALDARRMYEHTKAATAIYRSELAGHLARIGYRVKVTEKDLIIEGVSPALIEKFSTRSRELKRLFAENERDHQRELNNNERSALVHRNREKKKPLAKSVFHQQLKDRLLPDETKMMVDLVASAKGKQVVKSIQREIPKRWRHPQKKVPALELFQRLILAGSGRVKPDTVEKALLGLDENRNPYRSYDVGRGNFRLAENLLLGGRGNVLSLILRCITHTSYELERSLDVRMERYR